MCRCICFPLSVIKTLKRDQCIKCLWEEGRKEGDREGGEGGVILTEFSSGKGGTNGPQRLPNSSASQSQLKAMLKHRLLGLQAELLSQLVWGGAQEFAFLTSPQVMLMMLVPGPLFENH